MESTSNPGADPRLTTLTHWLTGLASRHGLDLGTLQPASSDASFRRYFRLQGARGTVIVMDAPPEHEDCRPFLHVTGLLKDVGLNVPGILEQDVEQGLLLLTDLGPSTYYQAIQKGLDDTALQTLYRDAIRALVAMQQAPAATLPAYDAKRLKQELSLFPEWYALRHCQAQLDGRETAMLEKTFETLVQDNARQPVVLVHRDFHSPNLMVCDRPEYGPNPGVIDYQDALAGPLTYDIASLVMDARTTWEEPQQLDWAIRYWEAARSAGLPIAPDFADFHRAYEWMSLQRNLRILGVFARLSHRDHKHHYLDHMPRVNAYVRQVASRYGVFTPLLRLLDKLDNRQVSVGYTF
ncbi:MAG TPA: phosphotransferase [Eoetvoesiella sp.]|uniref:aminoglycoside phosphotransferase family protein n=1 Tax=Eoetvoesiella sp. TaxID=1966355 RepID=UPI002BB1033C|nr:phosphotransferase [Eoetvoesiella sp.]HWK60679.1 phosphotransferase [Eoetvoesiella sp.]